MRIKISTLDSLQLCLYCSEMLSLFQNTLKNPFKQQEFAHMGATCNKIMGTVTIFIPDLKQTVQHVALLLCQKIMGNNKNKHNT